MARQVKLTAEEFAEKWSRRTKAATADMEKGVDRVTEAPGVKAAAQVAKMKAKINEALDNGKWVKRVASVSLEEWKADMKEKGIRRVSEGVDRANGKVTHFAAQLVTHQNKGLAALEREPDLTLSDSANRMVKWMNHMADMDYEK